MVSLYHRALIVPSGKSINFYDKLEFGETKRLERPYDTVVFIQCGEVTLEIFIDHKHLERLTESEAKDSRHIAFL